MTASGTALSYQWQRDGSNIAGATAASYSLSAPVATDSGASFRVVVTNAFGSVTSAAATLIVSASTGNGLRGEYYPAGQITLGGNVQPPGSGAGTHYIVMVQPQ